MVKPVGFAEVQQAFGDEAGVRWLREHLAKVAAGAFIVVTSRSQPVARLVPCTSPA